MRTVIIYESTYGNTRQVAEELAEVARAHGEAVLVPAEDATRSSLDGAGLVLVGGPTHLHGMSSRSTRRTGAADAAREDHPAGPDLPGVGLRDWFRAVGQVCGPPAAAFDTRMVGPEVLTGRASLGISRRLRHYGYTEVAAPRSFLVTKENHLVDGERGRAHDWAVSVFGSLPMTATR
jgi:Flavodoxin